MSRRRETLPLVIDPERPKLDQFVPGEYWFASGDFVAFATNFPVAHATLGHLCALKSADLNVCVRTAEKTVVERFAAQYHGNIRVWVVPDNVLLLLGQMIRVDPFGRASLYTPDESGFLFLNTVEAVRIRSAIVELSVAA